MGSLGWLAQPSVLPWVALLFGLCVGSFLNVVIYRLPRMFEREWLKDVPEYLGEILTLKGNPKINEVAEAWRALTKGLFDKPFNLALPRSHCPSCGSQIGTLQNVPILSYLVLRGRCSKCQSKIGLKYPLVELLTGLGTFYCAYRFGLSFTAAAACLFIWFTIALAFIDQETGTLPDELTIPLFGIGLLFNLWGVFVPIHDAVVGALAGYLSLWLVYAGFKLVTGKEGMGVGDFRMFAVVGAFFGWKMLLPALLFASIVGLVFGTAQMLAARGRFEAYFKFHFGPYLAFGGVIVLFWGDSIIRWWMYRL